MGRHSQHYNFKEGYKKLLEGGNNPNYWNDYVDFWSKILSLMNDINLPHIMNPDFPAPHFDIRKWKIYDLSKVITERNQLLNEYDFAELKDNPKLKKELLEKLRKIYKESNIPSYPLTQGENIEWGSLVDGSILSIAQIGYYHRDPKSLDNKNSIFPIYDDNDNPNFVWARNDPHRPSLMFRYQQSK
jgi:hypothetical protein